MTTPCSFCGFLFSRDVPVDVADECSVGMHHIKYALANPCELETHLLAHLLPIVALLEDNHEKTDAQRAMDELMGIFDDEHVWGSYVWRS